MLPMPRGLTAEQKLYAQEVFKDLMERHENQTEIGKKLGIDQSRVSAIRKDGRTSLDVLLRAARLANRSPHEVFERVGVMFYPADPRPEPSNAASDPFIGTFLLRMNDLPGLKAWLMANPEKVRVSEVWRGIEAYDTSPGLARESDGQPRYGWGAFFDRVRTGQLNSIEEGPEAVKKLEDAERRQNRGLGKPLHPAPRNITKNKKKDGTDV